MTMKVILKEEIKTLGKVGDVVQVKPGFARNYLIPKGMAVEATPSNMKVIAHEAKIAEIRSQKTKKEAQSLADRLSKVSVTASVQVGEEDRVFGAVTSQDIANLLQESGFEIDKKRILLEEPIKALGVFEVPIKVHSEVEAKIKVWVVRE